MTNLPLFDPPPETRDQRAAALAALPSAPAPRPWMPGAYSDPCAHVVACSGCEDCGPWRATFPPCAKCQRRQWEATMYSALCADCHSRAGGEIDPAKDRARWNPLRVRIYSAP